MQDHLGNTRVVLNQQGEVLQTNSYYPFGMNIESLTWQQETPTPLNPKNLYTYNGKELQEDFNLNWHDYGARFYDAQIGRWHVIDPMADSRTWLSPYQYAQNTPIMRTDPNGMLDDWVKNNGTDEYEWKDDVTSKEDTPEGYTYVGNSAYDIIEDLDISHDLDTQEDNTISFGLDSDRGGRAFIGSKTDNQGSISVEPVISLNEGTENNISGLKFEGISIKATLNSTSHSTNLDLKMENHGNLEIKIGNESRTLKLSSISESSIQKSGSKTIKAGVYIPTSSMLRDKNTPISASIKGGAVNNGLFVQPKPINMNWKIR